MSPLASVISRILPCDSLIWLDLGPAPGGSQMIVRGGLWASLVVLSSTRRYGGVHRQRQRRRLEPPRDFAEARLLQARSEGGGPRPLALLVFFVLVRGGGQLVLELVYRAAGLADEAAQVAGHLRELAGAEDYEEEGIPMMTISWPPIPNMGQI